MSSDEEVELFQEFLSEKNNNISLDESKNEIVLSSDDESDNEDLPEGSECLRRCKEFASITGTDNAIAMFYLQNNKWDSEKSVNIYLTDTQGSDKKVVALFDVEKLDKEEKNKSNSSNESGPSSPSKKQKTENEAENIDNSNSNESKHFKVLSWNIDGIDNQSLEARAIGVTQKILSEKPDLVLLQEVVNENEKILRAKLSTIYEFSSGNMEEKIGFNNQLNYYTMILTRKKCFFNIKKSIINFENSVMGRNLLIVNLSYANKVNICVMTAHLESTKEYGKQRTEQLRQAMNEMSKQDERTLVIFGGDLNSRDAELNAIGGLPKDIHDIWQSTGSRKECTYTWDMTRNTNLEFPGKFKPRCRFDRIYYKVNNKAAKNCDDNYTLTPVYFELEGLERLKTCAKFCSDHWAIQSYFDLKINPQDK